MCADEIRPWILERQREALFQESVLAFMGVPWPPEGWAEDAEAAGSWPAGGVGAACRNEHLAECLQDFGSGLALACSTCGSAYERTGRLN